MPTTFRLTALLLATSVSAAPVVTDLEPIERMIGDVHTLMVGQESHGDGTPDGESRASVIAMTTASG